MRKFGYRSYAFSKLYSAWSSFFRCSLCRCVSRIGFSCNGPHTQDVFVYSERETPRLFQIQVFSELPSLEVGESNNVASGIPAEPFKVWCACIALWAIEITSSVPPTTALLGEIIRVASRSRSADTSSLARLLPKRPHCPRNDGMHSCPCKMDRFFQVSSGSNSGRSYSAAVTHVEFCSTRYRTAAPLVER